MANSKTRELKGADDASVSPLVKLCLAVVVGIVGSKIFKRLL